MEKDREKGESLSESGQTLFSKQRGREPMSEEEEERKSKRKREMVNKRIGIQMTEENGVLSYGNETTGHSSGRG